MSNDNRLNVRNLSSFFPTQEFIKKEEGLKLTTYLCPAGVKTVGWGHAVEPHDGLNLGEAIIEERALQFLELDIIKAYKALFRLVHVPLNDHQQTALVSFIFNLGSGRFQASTLRQKLNRKEYEAAAQEFDRWVYARDPNKGLVKNRGLMSRRKREKMLFLSQVGQNVPLKPYKDIDAFKLYNSPLYIPVPSVWQKASAVFVGLFKAGY